MDCVLPEVPVRQWVLTLPYPLRYRCTYDARLTSAVLRAFLRALFAELRRRARQQGSAPRGQCGAVTFIQRFGSALNANLHFHTLVQGGVYARTERQPTRFLPLPPPSRHEVARVLAGTARRVTRLLASRADGDDDALARDEPLLASDRLEERPDGRLALRLKTRWRDGTTHILMEPHELLERLVPLIPPPRAHQVRYHGVLAPCASARDRVVPGPLPTRGTDVDGSTAREASTGRMEASVVSKAPGPGTPTHPCADTSACIEREPSGSTAGPGAREPGVNDGSARGDPRPPDRGDPPPNAAAGRPRPRRLAWAELLQRVFEVDALRCPRCGARMRLVAAIEDPDVARKILECLDLPARAPPLVPAPPASARRDDEFSGGAPAWDFDQTAPDEDGTV